MMIDRSDLADFPTSAAILFGLGIGGFFDGIVLHQVLQWHHMLTSAGYPPDSVENLQINTLWDGLFHASTYLFVLGGGSSFCGATHAGITCAGRAGCCRVAS